ncbi:HU family DNA-binding protein [Sulfurimonas sp.]|uniref:HU family DNA-binding protein n=1 Tax=Sulfurimonas sp. TaxID=2022749 RepID=UPI003563234B
MNEKLHYDDFVEQIVLESGYDNETVRNYLSAMFETIVIESKKGNSVKLRNFGSFQPRWYKAKRGINPQTGQPLDILPHYHIHFASSKVLKNAINEEDEKSFLPKLLLALLVLLVGVLIYFTTATNETVTVKSVKEVEVFKPVVQEVEKAQIIEVQEEQTIEQPVVTELKQIPPTIPSATKLYPGSYTVNANETLSAIGLKVYGDKGYWPLLYSANNSKVLNPDLIFKGSNIVVPDKTESNSLYNSYMDVHNTYMDMDKMGKSFWILCEGTHFMGKDFQIYLKEQLLPAEYPIIKRCSDIKK